MSDAYGKPLANAWFKQYCTNEKGFLTFPYEALNGENLIELRVYSANGKCYSHSGFIDTAAELPEAPIKISTSLTAPDNSALLPKIQIQVKALDADSIYVRCYSQRENRPQTTGFVCSERIIGKCQFDDLPFHEGFADENGIFIIPCVQYGTHFAEVTIYRNGVKTSQFFNLEVNSIADETVFVADTRDVATGYSLDELGYTTDFSAVRVRDVNNPSGGNVPVRAVTAESPELKGSSTSISASPYVKDAADIPIMLIQAFKKSEYEKHKFIEAGELLYNIQDLDKYKLFEDDAIAVYDMRFLAEGTSLSESIRKAAGSDDVGWLDKVYFRLLAKPFIKKLPPEANAAEKREQDS